MSIENYVVASVIEYLEGTFPYGPRGVIYDRAESLFRRRLYARLLEDNYYYFTCNHSDETYYKLIAEDDIHTTLRDQLLGEAIAHGWHFSSDLTKNRRIPGHNYYFIISASSIYASNLTPNYNKDFQFRTNSRIIQSWRNRNTLTIAEL